MANPQTRTIRNPLSHSSPPTAAIETLVYEIRTLRDAYQLFISEKTKLNAVGQTNSPLLNIALEGFLLHARLLKDFMLGTKDVDDILAIDFRLSPAQLQFNLSLLNSHSVQMNKLLAHPSYTRSQLSQSWPVSQLFNELNTSWKDFLQHLSTAWPQARTEFKNLGE